MTESPYERALGEAFERLHPRLRERYGLTSDEGRACVGRGRMELIENAGRHVRPALWLGTRRNLLFPETGRDVPVTIRNYAYRDRRGRETVSWLRSFETDPPRRFDAAMTYDPERDVVVDYLGTGGRLAVDLHFEVGDDGGMRIRSTRQRAAVGGRELPVPAALVVAWALVADDAAVAAASALPWLVVTLLVAAVGAGRLLPRGPRPVEELCVDAGLLYLPVGGGWLLASALGLTPLGFAPLTIFLTAVHFHFAGFALLAVVGLCGRLFPAGRARRAYAPLALGVVAGPGLVGVGIASSPTVEVIAVLVLTLAVAALGVVVIVGLVPALDRWRVRVPLSLAWAAVTLSMGYAFAHGVAVYPGLPSPPLEAGLGTMIDRHGQLNVGFALLATLGLTLAAPAPRRSGPDVAFSRLAARWRVGRDFLERNGLVDPDRDPTGMVDEFAAFERDGFDPATVDPEIARFYEDSAAFDLRIRPRWRRRAAPLRWLWSAVGRRVEQLNVPVDADGANRNLDGAVVAVDDVADGRENVRAWLRWYEDTGRAMYVATYATHESDGVAYLDAAFPLPGGNLTGVLRPESIGESGFALSSRPGAEGRDDAGLYLSTRLGAVRLPLDERLALWTPDDPGRPEDLSASTDDATVLARHDVWFAGRHLLSLDYELTPNAAAESDRRTTD